MELKEHGKGWCLAFRNASVHLIQIDFRLSLFLLHPPNEATVIVGTSSTPPENARRRVSSLRPRHYSTLAPILPFFNATVTGISNSKRRERSEWNSVVDPHSKSIPNPMCEAWQLASSTMGFLLVCSPGGAVALFNDR